MIHGISLGEFGTTSESSVLVGGRGVERKSAELGLSGMSQASNRRESEC